MKNSLSIKSELWPDITDIPHYIVNLNYEGHIFTYEDIYFDDLNSIKLNLISLEKDRKGIVELDGGFRFKFKINATSLGGIVINVRANQVLNFQEK